MARAGSRALPREIDLVLFGCESILTRSVLGALLAADRPPRALVATHLAPFAVPAGTSCDREIPVEAPAPIDVVARRAGIEVVPFTRGAQAAARERVGRTGAGVFVFACFPHVVGRAWLALPEVGALNVHPSLLPAYRGPAPVVWQLRRGEHRGGVTLHWMTEVPDAGAVLAQRSLPLGPEDAVEDVTRRLAALGAELLLALLDSVDGGERDCWPAGAPQDEAGASWFGWP